MTPEEAEEAWRSPTVVSLREYVEQRLDSQERTVENARKALAEQVQQRFDAAEQAIYKSEQSVSDRLRVITESLGTLGVRVEAFVTRQELATLLDKFALQAAENVQRQFEDAERRSLIRMDTLDRERLATLRELETWKIGLAEQMRLINMATDKAAQAMDRRLEGMNEFRQQLRDQSGQFIIRQEFAVQIENLNNQIVDLRASRDKDEGRRTVTTFVVASASSLIITLIGALVVFILNHR